MKISKYVSHSALVIALAAGSNPAAAATDTPARNSCATKSAQARMGTNYPAEWPILADALHASGKAIVKVDLSQSGVVRGASVIESSGNALLDRSAREATLSQRYTAQIQDCVNVAGSYLVEVDFSR